jgi:hypothetical protein
MEQRMPLTGRLLLHRSLFREVAGASAVGATKLSAEPLSNPQERD